MSIFDEPKETILVESYDNINNILTIVLDFNNSTTISVENIDLDSDDSTSFSEEIIDLDSDDSSTISEEIINLSNIQTFNWDNSSSG